MKTFWRTPWFWTLLLIAAFSLYSLQSRRQGPVIAVETAQTGPLLANIVATGRIATPSRVLIGTEIVGTLEARDVEPGDQVDAGQRVARLRAEEATARLAEAEAALEQLVRRTRPEAQAVLAEARARRAQAAREAARQRQLATQQLVPAERAEQAAEALTIAEAALRRAELQAAALSLDGADTRLLEARVDSARATLARSEIRSSVAGTVLRRLAEPGEVLSAGRAIIELARLGETEVIAQLDERNLDRVALGQNALVSPDAFPALRLPAQITEIAPAVDVQTGTVEVRLRLAEAPPSLRQDMTVSVDIEIGRRERALSVPNEVLRTRRGDTATVHVLADHVIVARTLKLGLIGLERSEVLEGLSEGEALLPASNTLAPGSRARPAVRD
ncbi:MAG: efflux RND transporter periplasmic adaptor subunit [Xanthomonadales bacterium]|nr:efflux RND transporter periplasmic adaptor subunit [Xanthomonadales bacterium]